MTKYKYTLSGLDNIYLLNGYTITHTSYGDAVSITDIDGLHKMIAQTLINKPKRLSPAEFKFLRKEMKLTQGMLSGMFGVTSQTVARIEKGETNPDVPYEALFRAYANEIICKKRSEITALIDEINFQTDAQNHQVMLQMNDNKWQEKAA